MSKILNQGQYAMMAKASVQLSSVFSDVNAAIVYEANGSGYKSWKPNRTVNAIDALVAGRGYIVYVIQTVDVTEEFASVEDLNAGGKNLVLVNARGTTAQIILRDTDNNSLLQLDASANAITKVNIDDYPTAISANINSSGVANYIKGDATGVQYQENYPLNSSSRITITDLSEEVFVGLAQYTAPAGANTLSIGNNLTGNIDMYFVDNTDAQVGDSIAIQPGKGKVFNAENTPAGAGGYYITLPQAVNECVILYDAGDYISVRNNYAGVGIPQYSGIDLSFSSKSVIYNPQ